MRGDGHLGQWAIPGAIRINVPIGLELPQPVPAIAAHELEVRQAALPTITRHQAWRNPALVRRGEHGLEMVVFRGTIRWCVVAAIVTRHTRIAITPQQRHAIDAVDSAVMLARPGPPDECDGARVGVVQGRIINTQTSRGQGHLVLGLGPEWMWIRIKPMQHAGESIMRGCVSAIWLHPSRFQATVRGGRGDQAGNRVQFVDFRRVHTESVALNAPTA